jgi:hypothetical protein
MPLVASQLRQEWEGLRNKYEVESKIDAPKGEEHPYIKPCEIASGSVLEGRNRDLPSSINRDNLETELGPFSQRSDLPSRVFAEQLN